MLIGAGEEGGTHGGITRGSCAEEALLGGGAAAGAGADEGVERCGRWPCRGGAGAELASASLMLSLLLIGLWSLLSQLLLWSDSAVMKVPSGVHVSDAHKDDVLTTTI